MNSWYSFFLHKTPLSISLPLRRIAGASFTWQAILFQDVSQTIDRRFDEGKKLKKQDGPELQVHGSGNFIQTLLKHDLVDELWLKIFPITLGMGKRLFAEGTTPAAFTLREAKTSPCGVIVASYDRAEEVKTGSFV
ncbi:MAG: dihydrofolate reductase family protein [Ktedonobacteraceae bacterium]